MCCSSFSLLFLIPFKVLKLFFLYKPGEYLQPFSCCKKKLLYIFLCVPHAAHVQEFLQNTFLVLRQCLATGTIIFACIRENLLSPKWLPVYPHVRFAIMAQHHQTLKFHLFSPFFCQLGDIWNLVVVLIFSNQNINGVYLFVCLMTLIFPLLW